MLLREAMVQSVGDGRAGSRPGTHRPHLSGSSQYVTSAVYQKAKELVQSGAIGRLTMVEACWTGTLHGAWQYSIPPMHHPQPWIGTLLGKRPSVIRGPPAVSLAQLPATSGERVVDDCDALLRSRGW